MDTNQVHQLTETFEGHAQQTESGVEYWLARDLQQLLGYAEWRNFNQTAISKAKTACEVSGHAASDHFVGVNKMIQLAKGAEREVEDVMLTRYACSGALYTYHFNMLRSIMEKTATFFGRKDFSECLEGVPDEALYARALNLLSHGKYSLYEPVEMLEDNKELFRDILAAFLAKHAFDLPALLNEPPVPSVPAAASQA